MTDIERKKSPLKIDECKINDLAIKSYSHSMVAGGLLEMS